MFSEGFKDFDFWNFLLLLLDIGLVAFFFYQLLFLLSRTRALQLLLGVILLILADVLAKYLELSTLSWLIKNISTYLVIGMIVLMQPELRRLAAGLEKKAVFRWLYPSQSVPVDHVLSAVRNMANKRVGSIIVILRNLRPMAIIERAVELNAKISSELIENIFWKKAPLHDGALVIEGQKIIAASCYLPLSNSPKLKKTHGARHRAALGISEESDALVIVTSEETGRISVLRDGNIYYPKTNSLNSLETLVNSLLIQKKEKGVESGLVKKKDPEAR